MGGEFSLSKDPLQETLAEGGVTIGIILIIVILFVVVQRFRNRDLPKKTGKTGKNEKTGKTTRHIGMVIAVIVVVVVVALSDFFRVYFRKITLVQDPAIRAKYSGMYDYQKQQWTSTWYKVLYSTFFVLSLPIAFFSRTPILP